MSAICVRPIIHTSCIHDWFLSRINIYVSIGVYHHEINWNSRIICLLFCLFILLQVTWDYYSLFTFTLLLYLSHRKKKESFWFTAHVKILMNPPYCIVKSSQAHKNRNQTINLSFRHVNYNKLHMYFWIKKKNSLIYGDVDRNNSNSFLWFFPSLFQPKHVTSRFVLRVF